MSTPPNPYNRSYNFEDFQSINPNSPLPAQHLENELNNIEETLDKTVSRLAEIQNSDGSIKITGNIEQNITNTAESVATSVATQVSSDYLSANFDSNAANSASASALASAQSATQSANSAHLASLHANYAEQATLAAQGSATQAASYRNSAEDFADQANISKISAHGSAQSAAASATEVGNVYNSALSLKNWLDSESFQFLHKREDMADAGAIMLFNGGEAQNTLIGKIFQGASVNAESSVEYRPPTSGTSPGNMDIFSGPWWVEGHDSPEDPHKIVMRDMMSCLVDTWLTFGPRVGPWSGGIGNLKVRQNGINGAPQSSFHQGEEYIKGVNYSKDGFGIGIINGSDPLTPKGYVDAADLSLSGRIDGKANIVHTHAIGDIINLQSTLDGKSNNGHIHSVSDITGLQAMIDSSKLQAYDNFKIYTTNDLVLSNDKIFKFNNFVGAAGYGPITHPTYWTEQSAQPDLTPYLTSANAATTYAVTARGLPTGGTTGQVLKKTSSSNYAVSWQNDLNTTPSWGNITGSISSQTDLNSALNGKASTTHVHAISDVTNLQTTISNIQNDLNNKASSLSLNTGLATKADANNARLTGNVVIDGLLSPYVSPPAFGPFESRYFELGNGMFDDKFLLKYETFQDQRTISSNEFQARTDYFGITSVTKNISLPTSRDEKIVNANLSKDGISFLSRTLIENGIVISNPGVNEFAFNITKFGCNIKLPGSLTGWSFLPEVTGFPGIPGIQFPDSTIQRTAFISENYVPKTGGAFTGKITATVASGVPGLNIGVGGIDTASTTPGDIWIPAGSSYLNYRDAAGVWRNCLTNNLPNSIDISTATSPALRITQRGSAPVIVIEDSVTPDSSAFVVDASGNVGIGVASGFTSTTKFEVVGNAKSTTLTTGSGPTFSINSTSTHTGGSDTLDLLVTINGVDYRIGLRPA